MSEPVETTPAGSLANEGCVILAATPIGNVADASARLVATLNSAQIVAAEDTRRLRALCDRLGIAHPHRVVPLHDHNEGERAAGLLDEVAAGATLLVVSDAGMPTVSDPGYRLTVEAIDRGIRVTCLPGPSAVLTALAVSGLATDRFTFEGFLPRKPGERAARLASLRGEERTMIFFEAPHRIEVTLAAMVTAFGATRRVALCRELTKIHEEVRRGTLGDIAVGVEADPPRGEIVLVVAGSDGPDEPIGLPAATTQVLDAVARGARMKEAVRDVAARTGVARNDLYDAAVRARAAHD